jgi:hypothetical protein
MASEQEPFAARDERTNAYHTYNAAGNGVQCPDRGNAPPTARSGDLQRRIRDRIKAWGGAKAEAQEWAWHASKR